MPRKTTRTGRLEMPVEYMTSMRPRPDAAENRLRTNEEPPKGA